MRDPVYDAMPDTFVPDQHTDDDCSRDVGELLECDLPLPLQAEIERDMLQAKQQAQVWDLFLNKLLGPREL